MIDELFVQFLSDIFSPLQIHLFDIPNISHMISQYVVEDVVHQYEFIQDCITTCAKKDTMLDYIARTKLVLTWESFCYLQSSMYTIFHNLLFANCPYDSRCKFLPGPFICDKHDKLFPLFRSQTKVQQTILREECCNPHFIKYSSLLSRINLFVCDCDDKKVDAYSKILFHYIDNREEHIDAILLLYPWSTTQQTFVLTIAAMFRYIFTMLFQYITEQIYKDAKETIGEELDEFERDIKLYMNHIEEVLQQETKHKKMIEHFQFDIRRLHCMIDGIDTVCSTMQIPLNEPLRTSYMNLIDTYTEQLETQESYCDAFRQTISEDYAMIKHIQVEQEECIKVNIDTFLEQLHILYPTEEIILTDNQDKIPQSFVMTKAILIKCLAQN